MSCLNKIKNWVTRENYIYQKPHSEAYELAKTLYYKNEEFIIGIENTLIGYNSIKKLQNVYIL